MGETSSCDASWDFYFILSVDMGNKRTWAEYWHNYLRSKVAEMFLTIKSYADDSHFQVLMGNR